MMKKLDACCDEIVTVRCILRRSTQLGLATEETSQALTRLMELAARGDDNQLEFECRRWAVHLETLRRAA